MSMRAAFLLEKNFYLPNMVLIVYIAPFVSQRDGEVRGNSVQSLWDKLLLCLCNTTICYFNLFLEGECYESDVIGRSWRWKRDCC